MKNQVMIIYSMRWDTVLDKKGNRSPTISINKFKVVDKQYISAALLWIKSWERFDRIIHMHEIGELVDYKQYGI